MPRGAMLTKKGCKHKYILPADNGKEDQWKCSWCNRRFLSTGELLDEWDRLNVPYKIRDISKPECLRNTIQKYMPTYRNR